MSVLENILGTVYEIIPKPVRPVAKKLFFATTLRFEAVLRRRRIYKSERIAFVDREVADLEKYEFLGPGPGEVTVKSFASVVSPGTEAAVLCGLPGARRYFPYYPGYSAAGIVQAVGKGVKDLVVGDRVAGRIPHAALATVPRSTLFPIPDGVDMQQAAYIELGIIVLQGIRKAHVEIGDKVLVLGQGLIGQMCNRIARSMAAGEVVAGATSNRRQKTATSEGGADSFLVMSDDLAPESIAADLVIEAVGTPGAIETAIRCAKPGGRVCLLGSSRGLSRNFDVAELLQNRNIEVVGAHIGAMPELDASSGRWSYTQEGELFLDMLRNGMLSAKELTTWVAKPGEANAVFERLANGGKSEVGIMFEWQR